MRGWGRVGAVVMLAMLAGCERHLPTYRYRMTVVVDTPQGPRAGSSVIEVRTSQPIGPLRAVVSSAVNHAIKGEAVAVTMPDGRRLFALLSSRERGDAFSHLAPMLADGVVSRPKLWRPGEPLVTLKPADLIESLKQRSGRRLLAERDWPTFVTFGDEQDARTVRQLDPADLGSFAPGARVRAIVVTLTDESVTDTGAANFPWIATWDTSCFRLHDLPPELDRLIGASLSAREGFHDERRSDVRTICDARLR